MSVVEVGIAIPDTYEELMALWGEDDENPNATLVLWARHPKRFFWDQTSEVQRVDVWLPVRAGQTATHRGEWCVDRFTSMVGIRIEQPDGPWDGVKVELRPHIPPMGPGDTLKWTITFMAHS